MTGTEMALDGAIHHVGQLRLFSPTDQLEGSGIVTNVAGRCTRISSLNEKNVSSRPKSEMLH